MVREAMRTLEVSPIHGVAQNAFTKVPERATSATAILIMEVSDAS
jgi:hypothetical protein